MPTPTGTPATTNLNNKITMPSTAAFGHIADTRTTTTETATTTPNSATTNTCRGTFSPLQENQQIDACATGVRIEMNMDGLPFSISNTPCSTMDNPLSIAGNLISNDDGNSCAAGDQSQASMMPVAHGPAVATALAANANDIDGTAMALATSNIVTNALGSYNTMPFAPEANVIQSSIVDDGATITPTTATDSSDCGSLSSSAIRHIRPQQVEDIANVRTTATTAVTATAPTVTSTTISTTSNVADALNGTANMNDTSL